MRTMLLLIIIVLSLIVTGCNDGTSNVPPDIIIHNVKVVGFDNWGGVEIEQNGYRRWLSLRNDCVLTYQDGRINRPLYQQLYNGAVFDYVVDKRYPACPIDLFVKSSGFTGSPYIKNRGN